MLLSRAPAEALRLCVSQFMEASDAAGQELNDLEDELEAAAAEERYADAAGIKARMIALSENDVAGGLMLQMDELLEDERCALHKLQYASCSLCRHPQLDLKRGATCCPRL